MIPSVNKFTDYTIEVASDKPEALKEQFEAIPLGSTVTFYAGKYWCTCKKLTENWKDYVLPAVAAIFDAKNANDIQTLV